MAGAFKAFVMSRPWLAERGTPTASSSSRRTSADLNRVPANGGSPIAVTKLDGHATHRLPQFLPDGRRFLYLAVGGEMPEILVGDLESSETKRLFTADTAATFVEPGLLLFVRQGVLLAQQFDTRSLETVGEPRPIAEPVAVQPGWPERRAERVFCVEHRRPGWTRTGGSQLIESVRLMWMDRSGKELEQVGEPGPYRGVELSLMSWGQGWGRDRPRDGVQTSGPHPCG